MRSFRSVAKEIENEGLTAKLQLRIVKAYFEGKGVHITAEELKEFSSLANGAWMDEYLMDVMEYDPDNDPRDAEVDEDSRLWREETATPAFTVLR